MDKDVYALCNLALVLIVVMVVTGCMVASNMIYSSTGAIPTP